MDKAIAIIKHFESLHDGDLIAIGLQPKLCPAGVWTVGYGHALVHPTTHKLLRGEAAKDMAYAIYPKLTEAEANTLLEQDYYRFSLSVANLLRVKPAAHELGAMTSLAYNIGIGNFKQSSVLRLFNLEKKEEAAEAFRLWNKSNGKVLRGLTRRRKAETHLFLHNEIKLT